MFVEMLFDIERKKSLLAVPCDYLRQHDARTPVAQEPFEILREDAPATRRKSDACHCAVSSCGQHLC